MTTTPTIRAPETRRGVAAPRPRRWPWLLVALLVIGGAGIGLAFVLGGDDPPTLLNGDFETGDLTGWSTQSWGSGDWFVYEDGTIQPDPSLADPNYPFVMPDPPQGDFAAVSDMSYTGVRFLYRDIEVDGPWTLHVTVFYDNHSGVILDPDHFGKFDGIEWDGGINNNRQFRIDLIDPEAAIYSLEPGDVLANVFRTEMIDPSVLEPTPVSIDLSPWEGETIRLRAAQIDNIGPLRAGIDNVWLES